MNDESIMPFGNYKGEKLANVPASYLLWCYAQPWCKKDLKKYIEENKEVLQQENKSQNKTDEEN